MENIELALLTVITSSETSGRGELSRSDAKAEGGFAGVLAGREERVEVDSEDNTIVPLKRNGKQTDKVEPEKRDKYNEQSRINPEDSEDTDVEMRGENLFPEVPSPEVLPEELLIAATSLGEELPQITENEGHDAGNPEPGSKFAGLLENQGNQQQNDLLAGIKNSNDEAQVSFVVDAVVGKSSEVVDGNNPGPAGEGPVFNDDEKRFLGTEGEVVAGSRAGKIKHSDGPGFVNVTQKSGSLSVSGDESSISPAKDAVAGSDLLAGMESAVVNGSVENANHVESAQISSKVNQEPIVVAADSVNLKVESESNRPIENSFKSLSETSSPRVNISPDGSVAAKIPEDVQIHINNELTVVKAKSENNVVRADRRLRNPSLSGGETGTVHLQGRARENQSIFTQGEQSQINYTDSKINVVDGETFSFSETSEKIFEEHFTLSSSTLPGAKEKQTLLSSDHTASKSHEMVMNSLESGKEVLVKNSSDILSAKSLPVSDENLMEQIQAGLTRQVKGRQTVTIKLWPENLGKVDVKLVLRDQQLTATFMVEQSDVKDAMLRKIDSLRDGLSLRGIDVKEIDIKVTPPKSGDGPSVTVGDQHQDSADAWRQYYQDGFSQSDYDSSMLAEGDDGSEDSGLLSENLSEDIISVIDRGGISGSLHIMA